MEISWKDNIKKKVVLAYLGGKPVKSIWLQRKQLYPDSSGAGSVLALRPMNASEGGDYGPWAWIMDIMKDRGSEVDYEFFVENKTDLNGGKDFLVVAKNDWSYFDWEEKGWSGHFDPGTYLLTCYSNEMRIWAGMQKVGGKIRVKMRNNKFLEKEIDIEPLLKENLNHAQIAIDLPYMYDAKDMPGAEYEGVSLGINFQFRKKGSKDMNFWYDVRVMGNPSGTTHIHGIMYTVFRQKTKSFCGGRAMKDFELSWWTPYDDAGIKLEWQKGDTGMVVELTDASGGLQSMHPATDYLLALVWPENEAGKYWNWDAVIERKA